ncbi:N-6 DNA methylase [Dellaglioa algida]|uniref:N-6 DNA methylase n=1 Tax=Dellaglioa algida TaxID=105612 RepID=UPI0024C490DE|nr:N-6 DNA methylase [Dellaglioa algida]MDK1720250.1 SAM-dependent methyltransferase [Dellaglioa algida]
MISNDKIDELIGVDESFESAYKLMDILKDKNERIELFKKFVEIENDFSFDWFTNYFQEEHSNRKNMKQDFTPDGLVQLANAVLGKAEVNVDVCSGTGGLTIKRYSENPNATFYCEEFSDRAIPFLLFNLAIRNVNAYVFHGDSLSRDAKAVYQLTKSNEFSDIELIDDAAVFENPNADTAIMNPPYSLTWERKDEYLEQPRFKDYGVLAPKSKADFAFLLQGLEELNDNGVMSIVLPHGVLFRGAAEGKIRQKLIENNYLDTIIGLPEKLFFNTDIPTVILVLKKNRTNKDIFFIDASKEFEKVKNHNELKQEHIDKVLSIFKQRQDVDKLAHVTQMAEIEENEFNLNIPRYVDTFEPEPVINLSEVQDDLTRLDLEIKQSEQEFTSMLQEIHRTDPETDKEFQQFQQFFTNRIEKKYHEPIARKHVTEETTKEMGQMSLL